MRRFAAGIWLCLSLSLLSASSQHGSSSDGFRTPLPETLPRAQEVELALSAAPAHLRKGAGVYAFEKNGFVQVRASSNGFTCIVNRDHPLSRKPTCYDSEGARTILPKVLRVGQLLAQGVSLPAIESEIAEGFRSGRFVAPRRPG